MKIDKSSFGTDKLIIIAIVGIILLVLIGAQLQPASFVETPKMWYEKGTGFTLFAYKTVDLEQGATATYELPRASNPGVLITFPWGGSESVRMNERIIYTFANPDNPNEKLNFWFGSVTKSGIIGKSYYEITVPVATPAPPSEVSTEVPTELPAGSPTELPTASPTVTPTESPTESPTEATAGSEGVIETPTEEPTSSGIERIFDVFTKKEDPVDEPVTIDGVPEEEDKGIPLWMVVSIIGLIIVVVYLLTKCKNTSTKKPKR